MYVVALDEVLVTFADTAVYVYAVVPPKDSASTRFVPPKSKIPKILVMWVVIVVFSLIESCS